MLRPILGAAAILFTIVAALLSPTPAHAQVTNARCDPDRPRNDVFVCGYVYGRTQADGTGRVLGKIRVQSQGDNSELDGCPGLRATVRVILPSRPGAFPPNPRAVWTGTDRSICRGEGYSRDFRGVRGLKVPSRAIVQVIYKQYLNFDADEYGVFEFRVS